MYLLQQIVFLQTGNFLGQNLKFRNNYLFVSHSHICLTFVYNQSNKDRINLKKISLSSGI